MGNAINVDAADDVRTSIPDVADTLVESLLLDGDERFPASAFELVINDFILTSRDGGGNISPFDSYIP